MGHNIMLKQRSPSGFTPLYDHHKWILHTHFPWSTCITGLVELCEFNIRCHTFPFLSSERFLLSTFIFFLHINVLLGEFKYLAPAKLSGKAKKTISVQFPLCYFTQLDCTSQWVDFDWSQVQFFNPLTSTTTCACSQYDITVFTITRL